MSKPKVQDGACLAAGNLVSSTLRQLRGLARGLCGQCDASHPQSVGPALSVLSAWLLILKGQMLLRRVGLRDLGLWNPHTELADRELYKHFVALSSGAIARPVRCATGHACRAPVLAPCHLSPCCRVMAAWGVAAADVAWSKACMHAAKNQPAPYAVCFAKEICLCMQCRHRLQPLGDRKNDQSSCVRKSK